MRLEKNAEHFDFYSFSTNKEFNSFFTNKEKRKENDFVSSCSFSSLLIMGMAPKAASPAPTVDKTSATSYEHGTPRAFPSSS